MQSVISKEAWNQYLALDEICNELECARYKAMYLAGAADYEKIQMISMPPPGGIFSLQ